MQSTMQDFPLTVGMIFRHGRTVHPDSEVVTNEGGSRRRATFAEVADRAELLAAALRRLEVEVGDRVGTLSWNTQEHLEAYFAIPGIGAVLHTLNVRLFPEQLAYIVNHAEDRVDHRRRIRSCRCSRRSCRSSAPSSTTSSIGDGDASPLEAASATVHRYDELLAAEEPGYQWPEIDERAAAAMCYTSGTTGNPKGVVYSHRSTFLHSIGVGLGGAGRLHRPRPGPPRRADVPRQRVGQALRRVAGGRRPPPPGTVRAVGAPRRVHRRRAAHVRGGRADDLERPAPLCGERHDVDLSSIREIHVGGAAVPQALMEAYDEHGSASRSSRRGA